MVRVVAALALAVLVVAAGGCAGLFGEIAGECAGRCVDQLLEAAAQGCIDAVCGDDDGAPVAEAAPDHPATPREVPPSTWRPREGSCDQSVGQDGSIRLSCPDGTRALFLAGSERAAREIVERERAGPDAPCTGARVIRQGLDKDGDGVLRPDEITGRTVDCPDKDGVRAPTLLGHLAVHGPADVARLSGRRALTGDLLVESPGLVRLELPELQSLGGALHVEQAPALAELSLPHLAAVGGDVVVTGASSLGSVRVPALQRVGGAVVVVDNPRLPEADVEAVVFRLSEHGFAGRVDTGGNAPHAPPGDPPPAPGTR